MANYTVTLKKREAVAEGTMAFYFEKPANFHFKAGQFMNVALLDPPETDAEGNTRTFSIASAPFEETLMIATRMRDTAFKRVLKSIPLGTKVTIVGPFGSFTLHQFLRPAVLLAGGIGITPFRSILLQATHDKLPPRFFLFYSNRRPQDAAFLKELLALENRNYRFIGTITRIEKYDQPWQGETGHITQEMLARYVEDLSAPIYYIAGPPSMVTSMEQTLNMVGVNDEDIRTEQFDGY